MPPSRGSQQINWPPNGSLGNDVHNKDGENLGDTLFPVRWTALALDTANKRFTLNVLKEALKEAREAKALSPERAGLHAAPSRRHRGLRAHEIAPPQELRSGDA